ncbi:hypothetical protein BJX61DRAFT_444261 [Aspergillus egyptiacus]|nr:hypothetical protein BJX61DRAFT_444261 [Aspergillus egyptiacus]
MSLDEKAQDEKVQSEAISPLSSPSADHAPIADLKLQVLPKILQEGILFLASGPALLLQAAHPGLKPRLSQTGNSSPAAASTNNLTAKLTTPLNATLSYIACLVFGTQEEKEALIARIRDSKPPLQGTTTQTNTDVQLWTLATIYATATDFYQRIYGDFDHRTAEKSYSEFALVLSYLSTTIPAGVLPASRGEFWRYWDEQVENLSVSAEAHKLAYELVHRTDLPRWAGYLRPVLRVITVEMLPARIRAAYGLKSTVGTRGMYRAAMGFSVAVWPALPKGWRFRPVRGYLEDVRRELNV